jgi:hypothetical protein
MNYEVFVHADLLQGVVPGSGLQRRLYSNSSKA